MPRRHPSRPSRSQSSGTDLTFLQQKDCYSRKAVLASGEVLRCRSTIGNPTKDLHRSGLLTGPPNGYFGRLASRESGLPQPQKVADAGTEEMGHGGQSTGTQN